MVVDNFDQIRGDLAFGLGNELYHVQIFMRRKDIRDLSSHCKKVRSYYVRSIQDFDNCKRSIIDECTSKGARAYINMNARDVKQVALMALKKTADLIYNGDYDAVKNVYDSACGTATCVRRKKWLIDIDTKDEGTLRETSKRLKDLNVSIDAIIPTLHGTHILVAPFSLNDFQKMQDVDVVKDGMVLLYVPDFTVRTDF